MTEWEEDEYVECLRAERRRYAWVMRRHGNLDAADAEAAALRRYPFEPAGDPWRGMLFHTEAWYLAIEAIHGHRFRTSHPHLAEQPDEYRALD